VDGSVESTVRLVDGRGHGWGIALLKGLSVGLVGGSHGQDGKDCDKGLERGEKHFVNYYII
jgi:hypothetical protein